MAHSSGESTRRTFIKQTGTAGAGLALGALGAGAAPAAAARTPRFGAEAPLQVAQAATGTIPAKRLGKTDVSVPVLGAGTALLVTPILLNRALDAGITFIDTAEGYGNGRSETAVGKILAANGKRDDCWIVTKTGDHKWQNLESHLDGSLKRLQTDYVDILYLHNLGDPAKLDDAMGQEAARLIATGKVRHFGFSSHHRNMLATMERAAEVDYIEAIMFKYNFRDYDNAELNRVMDACHAADIGLVAMKTQGGAVSFQDRVDPFAQAGLNKYQAALKAVYADERIASIVSAMKNVRQVEQNSAAAKNPQLTLREREALHEYRVATSREYCRGCGQHCMTQVAADTNVPDIMRQLMYYENYGDRRQARTLFNRLPAAERRIAGVDFRAAEAACPYGLKIGEMMERAGALLV